MKKFNFFWMGCLLVTSMCFLAGCDSKNDPDNPTNPVSDPEGTVTVSMRNLSNGATTVTPDNCEYPFLIGKDDNFMENSAITWKFVTIGSMKGLGNVTKIPTTGWAKKVSVTPGYGYVGASFAGNSYNYAKTAKVTYVRIYVTDWITGASSGGIIGAEVKYQSSFHFKPDAKEITVSETSVDFVYNVYWYSSPITVSPFNANWSVTSSDNNCSVRTIDINKFEIRSAIIPVTLTVKVEGLPDKTITVNQAGS